MSDFNQLIHQLKNIPLEDLSDSELDTLKETIIKLLVDVQIQKDINQKAAQHHTSTDDVQLKILQNEESKSEEKTTEPTISNDSNVSEPTSQQNIEYQIFQETIKEEIISIYSTEPNKNPDVQQPSASQLESKSPPSSNSSPTKKIVFTINDKFRILKKLFNNNSSEFEKFINELNQSTDKNHSEQIIKNWADQKQWDIDSVEYQLLIKQNQSRFK
ncbi:MAG: hypothetical protein OHK0036_20640 [Bacteroidia bacterium]